MRKKQYIMNWDSVPILVDCAYVALILGVTPETVRKACVSGELPAFQVGKAGLWRINKEDLMEYCKPKGGWKSKSLTRCGVRLIPLASVDKFSGRLSIL